MLNQEFLDGLHQAFPDFYERINNEAMHEASRLRARSDGDIERALQRARLEGAAQVWWPYVRGSVPFVGDERPAMETFSRLILTIDHIVGYQPPGMEAARTQVVDVLGETFDHERLTKMLNKEGKNGDAGTLMGSGLVAGASTVMVPFTTLRRARKAMRFIPRPMRMAIGVVVLATLASVPLAAGYSAGTHAEKFARNFGEPPKTI